MGYEAERLAIEKRLDDNWATTPIKFENIDYDPQESVAFVSLEIIDGPSTQISLGDGVSGLHRAVGTISIGIYVPINTGTKTARTYADTIAGYFRNWVDTTSGIHCRSPQIVRIGEDEGWFRYQVLTDYYRDESF